MLYIVVIYMYFRQNTCKRKENTSFIKIDKKQNWFLYLFPTQFMYAARIISTLIVSTYLFFVIAIALYKGGAVFSTIQ